MNPMPENQPTEPLEPMNNNPSGKSRFTYSFRLCFSFTSYAKTEQIGPANPPRKLPVVSGGYLHSVVFLVGSFLAGASLHAQSLYVSEVTSEITVFNASSGAFEARVLLPSYQAATGMTFDTSGDLFVLALTGSSGVEQIDKITPGGSQSIYATIDAQAGIGCIGFDSNGNLYCSDSWTGQVFKVAPGGAVSTFASLSETDSTGYLGLAVDSSNDVYVSNFATNTITEITQTGSTGTFATVETDPIGMAFNGSGDLFSGGDGSAESGQVDEVTETGSASIFAMVPKQAQDLAFDKNGYLYVATQNEIIELSPTGETVESIPLIYDEGQSFIAISPIPEPSTWAILVGCCLFIFLTLSQKIRIKAG
jgi:hypothetical protein